MVFENPFKKKNGSETAGMTFQQLRNAGLALTASLALFLQSCETKYKADAETIKANIENLEFEKIAPSIVASIDAKIGNDMSFEFSTDSALVVFSEPYNSEIIVLTIRDHWKNEQGAERLRDRQIEVDQETNVVISYTEMIGDAESKNYLPTGNEGFMVITGEGSVRQKNYTPGQAKKLFEENFYKIPADVQ